MIFYFSATGNSQHAAHKTADFNENIVSISEALKTKNTEFNIHDGKLGIVFPVYFFGVPQAVMDFINSAVINLKEKTYVYILMTCGASTANADKFVKEALEKKGISVNAVYSVKMVDTYVPLFKIADKAEQEKINSNADRELEKIKNAIDEKLSGNQNKNPGLFPKTVTFFSYPFYKHRRFTKKFYVEDSCIGCGLCEKICPSEAIKIEKGKPVWIKKQCNICLGCLHRCPKEAIQYGKKSKTSGRYFYK